MKHNSTSAANTMGFPMAIGKFRGINTYGENNILKLSRGGCN
jgi:hypothetical protein